jgi:putative ABC transport system permease protein
VPDPKTLYRLLLQLYPAHFREEYGKPLERQFLDEYSELQGPWQKSGFWFRAITDLAMSIPVEIWHEVRQDIGYAGRIYRQRSFTVSLALVALAITIGITTGVFSVVNAVMLRSLPFQDPDRLVQLSDLTGHTGSSEVFHEWAGSRAYLTDAAGYRTDIMTLNATGHALRVKVAETTSNFFSLLGSQALIGRSFSPGEDAAGRNDVAVVGYSLWQQLGADSRILGSAIRVNGVPLTVIGVGPQGLDYPGKTAIWVPSILTPNHLSRVRALTWVVNGRLKPGLSLRQASAQYRAESAASGASVDAATLARLRLTPLRDQLAGNVRRVSLVLFGLVLFVLLTACANLAHLLLSRVTERRKELLLRAALGASRGRLVQQLITETSLLTLAAAAGGLVVAQWAAQLAASVQPPSLSVQAYTILDWPVLFFAMGTALLTGAIFGVLPAGFIRRMQPATDPLRMAASGQNIGIRRLRECLVAVQAAFTVMLLAGALTMSRSFLKIAGADLGWRTDHAVVMNVALSGTAREGNPPAYYREVLKRLRAVPGVEAAGAIEFLPLEPHNMGGFRFQMEGGGEGHLGFPITATSDYLRATSTQLLQGRDFTAAEEAAAAPVAIVNETFARQFDAALHLVGKRMIAQFGAPATIIGVARTQRYSATGDDTPLIYRAAGWSPSLNMTLVARVQGKAELYEPVCRDAVRSVDPTVPVYNVTTLDERLRETQSRPRFYTTMVLFLSGFALLLAILGIHGVASFGIQQRTHEIGVRLAIGAQPRRLRAALVREGLLPVAGGMVLGVAAAVAFGRLLGSLMEGADPVGYSICTAAGAVLVAAAATAVWTATRRIVALDPIKVLRAD